MKRRHSNPQKAFADGYAKGRADALEEAERTIQKLKQALDEALKQNIAMRAKPNHLGA